VSGTFVSLLGRMSSLVNWGCRRGWQAHQQLRSLSTVAREFMCKTEGLGDWSHACARRRVMIVVTMLVMLVQADTTSLYPPKQVQVGAFCLFVHVCSCLSLLAAGSVFALQSNGFCSKLNASDQT
jgi:hypothetical protein